MSQNPGQDIGDDPLAAAIHRLDRALSALEEKFAALATSTRSEVTDALKEDHARVSAELEASRTRERALEDVAAEASAALGRAAAEVRAALSAEET